MPLEITFHGIPASAALRDAIAERVARLERLAPDAIGCHVTVEHESQRHQQGNLYRVHARLVLPGGELNVGHSPPAGTAHQDPYVAVRDTFDALRRRLEDHIRRQRGDVKRHAEPAHGRIRELYPDTGYGLIETDDGREVHFHRNSLAHGSFDALEVGREVRFVEIYGDDGPWAGSLHVSGELRAEAT